MGNEERDEVNDIIPPLIYNSDVSPLSTIWLHVQSHTCSAVIHFIASHFELFHGVMELLVSNQVLRKLGSLFLFVTYHQGAIHFGHIYIYLWNYDLMLECCVHTGLI